MRELTEIYVCLNSEERGPFDGSHIDRMLQEGSLRLSDKAWRPGLPDWTTLEQALGRTGAKAEPAATAPLNPATDKQKAFLSYMNVSFSPGLSKEQAALKVNDAMENPADPARLARWNEERLRLHPELYAADLQAKKENRPNTFYERVITEGKDCFHDVSKAHCQVLVGFLDVKYPNWDAREKEAAWDYFFPALAEKFPQLVNKAWRGRLHFQQGPRVADEVKRPAAEPGYDLPPLKRGSFLSAKSFALLVLVIVAAGGVLFVRKNPETVKKWLASAKAPAGGSSISFENGTPAPVVAKKPEPSEPAKADPAPAPVSAPPAKTAEPEMAMNTAPAPAMSAPAAEGEPKGTMNAAPAGAMAPPEGGAPPTLFTPPPAASSTPGAQPPPAVAPPSGPRTSARTTRPLTIKMAYGQITIAPGTSLKIIGREGGVVKLNYMNQPIAVPVAATDLEP